MSLLTDAGRMFPAHLLAGALITAATAGLHAVPAAAQTITVSGVVIRADGGAPIAGARVRATAGVAATTDQRGHFQIRELPSGRSTLVVQAIGYRPRVIDMSFDADTTIRVALERIPVQLDTVRTHAGTLTISGRVRDSATGARVLMGDVTVYPGARTVGILSGGFRLPAVPKGEVTLVIEGFQHLPKTIVFVATRDTSVGIGR